ncbi:FAD-dependent oxidoreductase [Microvirga aerophila]|uniref:GMC family oxidoreductase n=1 Tax=Microvirga aerophila TaxID=670291 RepID=A0A512BLP4_9HYPH|nr:GMC family oxidoreductase [Microvirga aerophila]GEO12880.1 GMC family oxidoreductase [Microvirga aerophila]
MMHEQSADILIIGSGIGGACMAAGLSTSGASVVILERGEQLPHSSHARNTRSIFIEEHYRPKEMWRDAAGLEFNPGNYYYVGGNSKFYGAVMFRYREQDFGELEHADGLSPAWPISYQDLEPWYCAAEQLFQVRGALGQDPTEPSHSVPYPHPPVPDEPAIASARERLQKLGLRPFSLPLAIDIDQWLSHANTPWDAYPDTRTGKFDAETAALTVALKQPSVSLVTGAMVERLILERDGRRVAGAEYIKNGERIVIRAKLVVLSAGAINSAAILLRSVSEHEPGGVANRSGVVGRHFMNHNATAMLTVDPRQRNDSVYQKTIGLNDFYFDDGRGGPPLGNVQLLGRISAPVLKASLRWMPDFVLERLARHSVDWYLMSEDLPDPESQVRVDGKSIVLAWKRTNMTAHRGLIRRMKEVFRAAGYPIVLARAFDKRTPSHQCGTIRFGHTPSTSALDPFCRAHDHPNLFVVDASFMPSSAAVNPSLTVAAQALRVADHIQTTRFAA